MNSISNSSLFIRADEYPLVGTCSSDSTIAWSAGEAVNTVKFLRDVYSVASQLPEGQYAINLCEDRYWFLVGFSALLVNNQTNLLPPSRATEVINEIACDYPDAFCLCDSNQNGLKIPTHQIKDLKKTVTGSNTTPLIPGSHLAAIVFTSGSTGKPRPNPKYWKDLVTGARMKQKRFGFGISHRKQAIVVTVPPQHMYGLETSILNPLINGVSIYTNKVFFPADINAALNRIPEPRVLVTTPIHLKSCIEAGLDWPVTDFIISATAPLDKSLARRSEAVFKCPVLEIYGCTEANSMASRRTVTGKNWLLYEGTALRQYKDGLYVSGPNLPVDVPLSDVIELVNKREFVLHGRNSDMINIGGKRASLEDLNIRIRSIEGVNDAAFVCPEPTPNKNTKLAAFVVSSKLDAKKIKEKLALKIDPVFLPRPLYIVDKLPRNESGKLPRAVLLDMLNSSMGNAD